MTGTTRKIKFSKTQLSKLIQSGGFLLGPLSPVNMLHRILCSYAKELKNMNPKGLEHKSYGYIFANAGLNILSKKVSNVN